MWQPDQIIAIREKAKKQLRISAALGLTANRTPVSWIEVDPKEMKGTFKAAPEISELPAEFKVSLVVELYSK